MPGGRRHYNHVLRVLGLFAAGFTAFLLARHFMIPADFDLQGFGFYRAGALDDIKKLPVVHAGQTVCLDCHSDVGKVREGSRHRIVHCEACHGPLEKHVADSTVKPAALNPRLLCLKCHTTQPGLPVGFPNINPAEHMGDLPCTDCHKPHSPKIG
jgi:hypothetical protein